MGIQLFGFLILQTFLWHFCKAGPYRALDPSSSFYTFGPGWIKNEVGEYSTTNGSVLVSFKGSNFSVLATPNAYATVTLYVDGQKKGVFANGIVPETTLASGDHQIVLAASAPSSDPYIFSGIGFPVSNGASLNVTEYIPQTYGINASEVPSDAITLDNTDYCMLYEDNDPSAESHWERGSDTTADWGSYNGSRAVPRPLWSMMTISFHGTGIWLFFSQVIIENPGNTFGYIEIDSVDVGKVLSPFTTSNVALRQKLLWSRTNLTNTNHTLRLQFTEVRDNQKMGIDFARVRGTPMDCRFYTPPPGNPGSAWNVTAIITILLVSAASLGAFISCIFCCVCCSRERKRMRLLAKQPSGPKTAPESVGVGSGEDKPSKLDDGSSFTSIMTRQPGSGPQTLFPGSISEFMPTTVPPLQAEITPFLPDTPGTGQKNQVHFEVELRRDGKYAANHSHPSSSQGSVGGTGRDPEATSPPDGLETTALAGSDNPCPLGTRRSSRGNLTALPTLDVTPGGAQNNSGWSPAPPSYMTGPHDVLPEQRAGERMRVLTQNDLERLVDRVAVLRGGGTRLALVGGGPASGQGEEEEADPVEMLARQIAETEVGSGPIETSVRREKGV